MEGFRKMRMNYQAVIDYGDEFPLAARFLFHLLPEVLELIQFNSTTLFLFNITGVYLHQCIKHHCKSYPLYLDKLQSTPSACDNMQDFDTEYINYLFWPSPIILFNRHYWASVYLETNTQDCWHERGSQLKWEIAWYLCHCNPRIDRHSLGGGYQRHCTMMENGCNFRPTTGGNLNRSLLTHCVKWDIFPVLVRVPICIEVEDVGGS